MHWYTNDLTYIFCDVLSVPCDHLTHVSVVKMLTVFLACFRPWLVFASCPTYQSASSSVFCISALAMKRARPTTTLVSSFSQCSSSCSLHSCLQSSHVSYLTSHLCPCSLRMRGDWKHLPLLIWASTNVVLSLMFKSILNILLCFSTMVNVSSRRHGIISSVMFPFKSKYIDHMFGMVTHCIYLK